MNKNLDKVLSEEVKRFNSIMAYQEKLGEGHHYKFYEAEEDAPAEEVPAADAGVDTAVPDAELGVEAPATDAGVDTAVPDTEMGAEPGMEVAPEAAPVDPEGGEMPPAEGDTEIDVTDLVNTSKELSGKTDSIIQKIADSSSKIEAIINKVSGVEQGLQKMDSVIQQMNALTKQVELMRPPTEEERRKALAKDSYPFSVTQDEYMSGNAPKTQTDLENRPDKLTMMDSLMNNYNEMDIKNSFYNANNNEKPVSNY
jgi:hypothetical protein